jgi:predicted HicB family RNase H-like nuclease
MPLKKSGLGQFVEPQPPPAPTRRRNRGKGEKWVGMTIRFTHEQWRTVHEMAMSEGVSINQLVIDGLNALRHGLPPL